MGYGLQYQDHTGCLKKSVLLNFFELLFFLFYFQISTFTWAWYFQIVFWKVCKIQYTHISLILPSHEWKNSLLNIWKKLNLEKRPEKPKETWKQYKFADPKHEPKVTILNVQISIIKPKLVCQKCRSHDQEKVH